MDKPKDKDCSPDAKLINASGVKAAQWTNWAVNGIPFFGPIIGSFTQYLTDQIPGDDYSKQVSDIQQDVQGSIQNWRIQQDHYDATSALLISQVISILSGGEDGGVPALDLVVQQYTIPIKYNLIRLAIAVFFLFIIVIAIVYV